MHSDMYCPYQIMIFIPSPCGPLLQISLFRWLDMWQPSCSSVNIGLVQEEMSRIFEGACGSWLTMGILVPHWIFRKVPTSVKKKLNWSKNSGENLKSRPNKS